MSETKYPRRTVLKGALLGVATIPVASLLGRRAEAAALPHVDPNDPQAKSLGYIEDATKVDQKANPNYKSGQHCANCLQSQLQGNDQYVPCNIFPGKAVNVNGWCKVWVKRP
jgi:high potential iron-sulfur protein